MPRNSPIASAACTMPAPRSSSASVVSGGSGATAALESFVARIVAVPDVIAAHTSAASGPTNFTISAAGAPTTRPTMPDTSDRRELARTSSVSSLTTVGTSAALAMP